MKRSLSFAVLALVTAACASGPLSSYHVTPIRTGAVYTSKGSRCDVRFENLSFLEASSQYQQIGMVTLSGAGDEFTDAMKNDVAREACKMGGDVATLNVGMRGAFQFLIWRRS